MAEARVDCRKARADDAAELAEMRWAMRLEGGETPLSEESRFLAQCAAYYRGTIGDDIQSHWVAAIGGGIAGTISVHRVQMVPRPCRFDDHFGCITNNYVRPELRGRGIAGTLLRHVVAAAAAEDHELLIVWPSEPAVPF